MNHQINILFDHKVINIADSDVCFCRLMSQLADVNIQSSVGMFSFYLVLYSSFCYQRCTRPFELCFQISRVCYVNNIYNDLHLSHHNASLVWTLDSTKILIG